LVKDASRNSSKYGPIIIALMDRVMTWKWQAIGLQGYVNNARVTELQVAGKVRYLLQQPRNAGAPL